jgi:heat-inducible transcriptional repressor
MTSSKSNEQPGTALAKFGLTERAQRLLKLLVERYIREGQPVGSRALSRDSSLRLSAATIRNVMADLEELGFLQSPHTSAGRVPTVRGYRLFVDSLLTVNEPSATEAQSMHDQITSEEDTKAILRAASDTLSSLTHLAGVVMAPHQDEHVLRQVEFLPLSDRRVLVILVTNEQDVENRIIQTARDYSAAELQQLGGFLTEQFTGAKLSEIRRQITTELEGLRTSERSLVPGAINLGGQAFAGVDAEVEYLIAGQTNLMDIEELSDVQKLRAVFDALARKREVLRLLEQSLDAQGTQIFIGDETGFAVMDEYSVVTAPYSSGGRVLGVLGVIGPTRMAYARVIPIVDLTARLLGSALNLPK